MSDQRNALEAALERWNDGNLAGYLELYDERIRLYGYSPAPLGKEEVRAFYQAIFDAFDGPQLEFHETLWEGERCAIRFTMTGTHGGEFMGVPATGRPVELPGITILHFEGPCVIERHSSADMLGLLMSLGAVPAPA